MKLDNLGKRLAANYRTIALVVLNTIIAFVVLNLIASGILHFSEHPNKKAREGKGRYSYRKYEAPLKAVYPNLDENDVNQLLTETQRLSLSYDPYTQFKDTPIVGKFINADIRGFRPIRNQGPWPPNPDDINIFVFGGSTTFGYGVPDYETIASNLQDVLNERVEQKIKVYNFGRCSYISVQERILLEKMILAGTVPNIVVFIDGLNDLVQYDGNPSLTKELSKLMAQGEASPLVNYLLKLPILKMFVNPSKDTSRVKEQEPNKLISDVIARYKVNKELVESFANDFRIQPIFVWQPVPVYRYDQDYNIFRTFDYDDFLPYVRQGYEDMARAAANGQFGDNFLWLADIQDGLKEPLYVDAAHYSGHMSRIIAEHIASKMQMLGMMKKREGQFLEHNLIEKLGK